MDSISKLTRLLEALRLQQTGSNRPKKSTATSNANQSARQTESAGKLPEKTNLEKLNRRISERISPLALEDQQGDKAVQLFVDSVLAWEFGEELLESGSFLRYSKQIRAAIISDSKLNLEFLLLLKSLKQAK